MFAKLLCAFSFFIAFTNSSHSEPIILGYWENWGAYHGFPMPGSKDSNEILRGQLTGLNAINYSFLEINSQGIYFTDPWADLDSANPADSAFCQEAPASCPNFKAGQGGLGNFSAFLKTNVKYHTIAIGGASHDDSFEAAFKNPEAFMTSLNLLLKNYPAITGIDLDYEPLDGVPVHLVQAYVDLIKRIKKEHPEIKLSWTLMANSENMKKISPAIWQELSENLDYIGVMGYDFHGAFDKANPYTNLHSSLYSENPKDFSIDKAMTTLNQLGIPNHKLLLGMPMYGRAVGGVEESGLNKYFTQSWKGDLDPSNCSTDLNGNNICPGVVSHKDLINNYPKANTAILNGEITGAWTYDPVKKVFISWDNKDSAIAKAEYAKNKGLAGVFFWSLRSDLKVTNPESILTAVASVYGIKTYQPDPIRKAKIYSYFAGWNTAPIPDFKMDGIILAFALLEKNGSSFNTRYPSDFNVPVNDPNKPYTIWNNWVRKFFNDGARAYISYGGATNDHFRGYIINASDQELQAMATEIQQNIARNYFDGVDLDIEHWWSYSLKDNIVFAKKLATLVKMLRQSLDADPSTRDKPIFVAVGFNAADRVPGMENQGDNAYGTSMQPFFKDAEAMKAVNAIFVMAYNIHVNNLYARHDLVGNMLKTFTKAGVPEEKLMFGIQPYQVGNQLASLATIQSLAAFIKSSGYGGVFMWGIGTAGMGGGNLPMVSSWEYLNAIRSGL